MTYQLTRGKVIEEFRKYKSQKFADKFSDRLNEGKSMANNAINFATSKTKKINNTISSISPFKSTKKFFDKANEFVDVFENKGKNILNEFSIGDKIIEEGEIVFLDGNLNIITKLELNVSILRTKFLKHQWFRSKST